TCKAASASPSILLLNDRFDETWRATVDGKPSEILRANFVCRGVSVPEGEHVVEFYHKPSTLGFWVTAGAEGFGLALCGLLAIVYLRPARGKSSHAGVER